MRRVGQVALTPLYLLYEKRLLSQVRRRPVPRHVGLILDGNRRYGRRHNLSNPLAIYATGAEKLDDLLSWCADLTIPAITLWVFSTDNFGRRPEEVSGILTAVEAKLRMLASDPRVHRRIQSVATFYARLMEQMAKLDLHVHIHRKPNEVADPIPFDRDESHAAYDREYANRYWRMLVQADRVLTEFRARFAGKCSPVHFFWGAPDLAVTRFSGRRAPEHPGGVPNLPDTVTREAYSHEVSSCGFWAGGGPIPYPAFYSYAYPEPAGFAAAPVKPDAAFYSADLREFILPYDRRPAVGRPGRDAARISADDLRGRGEPREMGPRRPGTRKSRDDDGTPHLAHLPAGRDRAFRFRPDPTACLR